MEENIKTLQSKNGDLTWINIVNAKAKEIDYLKQKFKFNEHDLNDSYAESYAQRVKAVFHDRYAFFILQFPAYDRKNRAIYAEEIDIFVTQDHLISLHKNNFPPLKHLIENCAKDKFYREQNMSYGNGYLLYRLIYKLFDYCYPILDHISVDIKNIEKSIFSGREEKMIREIMLIKRNIFNCRKILQPHKNIIQKMVKNNAGFVKVKNLKNDYDELVDFSKEIWEILEGEKDLIESLETTNSNLFSSKLNKMMATLTMVSVILLPLSLIANMFSMYPFADMPLLKNANGFLIVADSMLIASLTIALILKRKRWM